MTPVNCHSLMSLKTYQYFTYINKKNIKTPVKCHLSSGTCQMSTFNVTFSNQKLQYFTIFNNMKFILVGKH